MILVVGRAPAEHRADLRQQLRADHDHRLLRDRHPLRCLAQIEVVGDRLGDDRVEQRVVERLQPVIGHGAGRRIGLPCRRDRRSLRQRLLQHFAVLRQRRERAARDQRQRTDECRSAR